MAKSLHWCYFCNKTKSLSVVIEYSNVVMEDNEAGLHVVRACNVFTEHVGLCSTMLNVCLWMACEFILEENMHSFSLFIKTVI